eukprot:gene8585-17712_t
MEETESSFHGHGDEIESDFECRVCRGGPEVGRPLYSPCLCSGSIMFCHQDCLEEWLQHSRKESCELCNAPYMFIPLYAENTPETVPIHRLALSVFRKFLFELFPFALRVLIAGFLWLLVVPISTSWLYRFWIHGNRIISFPIPWATVWGDMVSGIVLAGVIALSFIVLLSFADFLRFHWNRDHQGEVEDVDGVRRGVVPPPVPVPRGLPVEIRMNDIAIFPENQGQVLQPVVDINAPPVAVPPIVPPTLIPALPVPTTPVAVVSVDIDIPVSVSDVIVPPDDKSNSDPGVDLDSSVLKVPVPVGHLPSRWSPLQQTHDVNNINMDMNMNHRHHLGDQMMKTMMTTMMESTDNTNTNTTDIDIDITQMNLTITTATTSNHDQCNEKQRNNKNKKYIESTSNKILLRRDNEYEHDDDNDNDNREGNSKLCSSFYLEKESQRINKIEDCHGKSLSLPLQISSDVDIDVNNSMDEDHDYNFNSQDNNQVEDDITSATASISLTATSTSTSMNAVAEDVNDINTSNDNENENTSTSTNTIHVEEKEEEKDVVIDDIFIAVNHHPVLA